MFDFFLRCLFPKIIFQFFFFFPKKRRIIPFQNAAIINQNSLTLQFLIWKLLLNGKWLILIFCIFTEPAGIQPIIIKCWHLGLRVLAALNVWKNIWFLFWFDNLKDFSFHEICPQVLSEFISRKPLWGVPAFTAPKTYVINLNWLGFINISLLI